MKKYFDFLDKLSETYRCMYSAAPALARAYPKLTLGKSNSIVLEWIKERNYYGRYTNEEKET